MHSLNRRLTRFLSQQARVFEREQKNTGSLLNRSSVHEMRIATRRTRAALRLTNDDSATQQLNKKLREFARDLGQIRELDIAVKDAKAYGLRFKWLKRHRMRLAQKYSKGTRKFERMLLPLIAKKKQELRRRTPLIDRRLHKLSRDLSKWKTSPLERPTTIHRFRKTVKRTRYTLEALGESPGPLKRLQASLGRAHDLEILESLSRRQADVHGDLQRYRGQARRLAGPAIDYALRKLRDNYLKSRSPRSKEHFHGQFRSAH